ncbi:MAG: hypothetical protein ACPW61_09930 [Methyloligella sp. ZOD6]
MIAAILYGALGFFLAGLIAVLFVPALWNRAARITRRQLEDTLPMTSAEIQADKDRLRAEFATELRQIETELEKAKAKAVRELVETSKRRVRVDELESELGELKTKLDETESAKQALEQTLSRGLPQMEEELKVAREAMVDIEKTDKELRYRYGRDKEALRLAQATVKRQADEIHKLRAALEADEVPIRRLFGRSDSALAKENRRLVARLSMLEEELATAHQFDSENYLLREEMRKLSMQILRTAQGEDTALPELIPEEPPEGIEAYRAAAESVDEKSPEAEAVEDETAGDETSDAEEDPAETSSEKNAPEAKADSDLKADPDTAPKQAKTGLRSRLKDKLANQPKKSANGESKGKSASLSERLAARRDKTPKPADSAKKKTAGTQRKEKTAEPVGSEQG